MTLAQVAVVAGALWIITQNPAGAAEATNRLAGTAGDMLDGVTAGVFVFTENLGEPADG